MNKAQKESWKEMAEIVGGIAITICTIYFSVSNSNPLAYLNILGFGIHDDPTAKVVQIPTPPTTAELLTLVNAERAKVHVAPLTIDSRINSSAQYKASDMVTRNYFDHKDPVTGKLNGLDKLNELDKDCSYVSENIAEINNPADFTSQGAITGFVNSPPHYAAMINPVYKTTGFGIAGNKVVEQFCQPA